jgi:hypothetical protein
VEVEICATLKIEKFSERLLSRLLRGLEAATDDALVGAQKYVVVLDYCVIAVSVKWQKEQFNDLEVDETQPPVVFKTQLFSLTGVPPERQKIMVKGGLLQVSLSYLPKIADGSIVLVKS